MGVSIKKEQVIYEVLETDDTPYGKLVVERINKPVAKTHVDIPLRYEKSVKRGKDDIVIVYPVVRPPSDIDEKKYYPAKELRITDDTLLSLDFVPQWKAFDFIDDDGNPVIDDQGNIRKKWYFIQVNITECLPEEDCQYFDMPEILGSQIKAILEAKKNIGFGMLNMARRRAVE